MFKYILLSLLVISPNAVAKLNKTNPKISANLLVLGQSTRSGVSSAAESPNGFSFQEAELRFTSNIDVYFRGDIVLAVEKEDGEFVVEPEEAFVETLQIPHVTFKFGKFYSMVTKHNTLHTHSYPFIDAPLVNTTVLGEEGLNEVGVSASLLLPSLPWFSELTVQMVTGTNTTLYNPGNRDHYVYVAYLKNLWDLTESLTAELGAGYATGENSFDDDSNIFNSSLTIKYNPIKKKGGVVEWTTEYLASDRKKAASTKNGGVNSWIRWNALDQWWIQARAQFLDRGGNEIYSGLIGFVPTEFSSIRAQYDNIDDPSETKNEHKFSLQLNVSLGTHPAHAY